MRLINTPALVLVLVGGFQVAAVAGQSGNDRPGTVRAAALNQLGILEYCSAQGMVEEATVSSQRDRIQHLSGSEALNAAGVSEEESGRAGFLAFDRRQGRFEESAAAQGLTLKTACELRAAIASATLGQ